MNLPRLSIRRPVSIVMAILAICLIGSVSLSKLKLDLLPNLNITVGVVTARLPGAGPREVESLVTKPLEQALSTVSNIESIETVSTNEYGLCTLYFSDDTDMNFATLEMREKIELVKGYLPKEVREISVMRIDPNNFKSTFELGVSSDLPYEDMTRLTQDQIVNRLKRISGVASVTLSGGETQEVRIELLPERLVQYGLNETTLAQFLMTENLNIPAGNIDTAGQSIFIRTNGEYESLEEIRQLNAPTPKGTAVPLKDLANISLVRKEKTSESFVNGKLSLNLSIQKQSNANTVLICKAVRDEIERLEKVYPQLRFHILYDGSKYITQSINSVAESALQGGLLAVIILYLFLRNFRATLIIAIAMPVSIVTTFVLMYFSGITLNLISLAGLALGIGMLVDNAIVVLENIYRHRHEGKSLAEAAEVGAKEVMLAISASTLTTVVVFVPIIFVEGFTGKVFKDMGLTITFSLMASLIIAITFIPAAASKLLAIEYIRMDHERKPLGKRIFDAWEGFYNKVSHGYGRILEKCLKNHAAVIIIAVMLFIASLVSLPMIGLEYFPAMDEGVVTVEVVLPKGTALSETQKMAFEVQQHIESIPEVKEINMVVGGSTSFMDWSASEKAVLTVQIGSIEQRRRHINQISEDIRKRVKDLPGAKITVVNDNRIMGISIGSNEVDIRISGEDTGKLKEISDEFVRRIGKIKGVGEIEASMDQEIDEASIEIDRNKALLFGLTTAQVGQAIQSQINGIIATRFSYRGSDIDVVVSAQGANTKTLQNIQNISILSPRGVSIPLSELADITLEKSPASIVRNNQKRTVVINAALKGRALNKVTEDIEEALEDFEIPAGYTYVYGGQQKEMYDSFSDLFDALIISVLIVFMLLAAQFESLLQPFIILLAAPLALTGALFSLLLTGKTLSIPAFIGIIILVGIVVDNAIVLIDCINRFRKEGLSREEAIIKAGPLRLRPILMTTLTTILGMLPMAIARKEGSEIQSPLAIVVMGGLTVSTLVTLIVIPSFYTIFDQLTERIRSGVGKRIIT